MMQSFKSKLGLTQAEPQDEVENCCPAMTYRQRLVGFVTCFILGMVISWASNFFMITNGIKMFALFYTVGNIIAGKLKRI